MKAMSKMPSPPIITTTITQQQSQRSDSVVAYTPSSISTPPSSLCSSPSTPTTIVDVTYQIVLIKPTNNRDWLMPSPSDRVQITGPVGSRGGNAAKCNEGGIVEVDVESGQRQGEGDDGFEIPCAARLTWGDRSIHLRCSYYPSVSLFTDPRGRADDETVVVWADDDDDDDDEADEVRSVGITMQDAIFPEEDDEDEMAVDQDEDVRDDNGNAFMILHVNKGLAGVSARLYCKKVTKSPQRSDGRGW